MTPPYDLGAPTATKAPLIAVEGDAESTPTPSATPVPSPTSTPSPSPSPTPHTPALAFASVNEEKAMNVSIYDMQEETQEFLTRFPEPDSLVNITWSHDGQWIIFVSTHDFIHSRANERNIFRMRPDGTQREMLTGQYVDPAEVPAPYGPLRGRVEEGEGDCFVSAQGSKVVEADDDGTFEIPGVPLSATWARVVCRNGQEVLQGEVDLSAEEEEFPHTTIPVASQGRGWCHASLSRDGSTLAGLFYQWTLDEEGGRQYEYEGVLYDIEEGRQGTLERPEDQTLRGLAWSPTSDQLVGTLSGEEGTSLWLWDAEGNLLDPLLEIPNPEQETAVATEPAWSPDGSHVAFALRYRHWWEDSKYRTDIILVSTDGDLTTLVESEWGDVARHPTWSADGEKVYYQFSPGEPEQAHGEREHGDIWSVRVADPTPSPLTEDGSSFLPAFSPGLSP